VHGVFEHTITGGKRFIHEVETEVCRIGKALTNVARHAKATGATVRLWARESVLGVQIEDAGVGFHMQSLIGAGKMSTAFTQSERESCSLSGGQRVREGNREEWRCGLDMGHMKVAEKRRRNEMGKKGGLERR